MEASEKQRLLEDDNGLPRVNPVPEARPAPGRFAVRQRPLFIGLLLLTFALVLIRSGSSLPFGSLCVHHHHHHHGAQPIQYPGEKISWTPCGTLASRPLECSNLTVPMDQFHPGASDKTFTLPLIRLRSANDSAQNILLNPGGPGGSGVSFVWRKGADLHTIVGDGFHLLSFDPRGINGSVPNATCTPPGVRVSENQPEPADPRIETDSGAAFARARNYAMACRDTMGEHGRYIDTPQTAADMNSILDAVGQKDMVYWGFSYGTLLGQTYATLFPERSRRVIIDGVANQFDWYTSKFDNEAMQDTERVFDGFLEECVKAGPKNCSLAGISEDAGELYDKIMDLAEKLVDDPLDVYVNSSIYGLFYRSTLLNEAIFPALYKPAQWYDLASKLASLLQGNASAAFMGYGQPNNVWDGGAANHFVSLNDGVAGPKSWPGGWRDLVDESRGFWNQSLFSMTEYESTFTRQAWAVDKTHSYVPRRGVKTAHPLLILSTTYDPICPLISARSAEAAFVGSRIVEVQGYGHCSIAVPSLCATRYVREFLYEGKLPDAHMTCGVDGPYFIAPEEGKAFATAGDVGEDAEEQRIHAALVEMARDSWFPM